MAAALAATSPFLGHTQSHLRKRPCRRHSQILNSGFSIKAIFWGPKKAVESSKKELSLGEFSLSEFGIEGDRPNFNGARKLSVQVVSSISEISPDEWDACSIGTTGPEKFNPFLTHGFLSSLEESHSAVKETGWVPQHVIAKDDSNNVLGVIPLYLKSHSYGEYVFDHSWADAYYGYGSRYYPKLQCCVPFTPVTGPRILVRNTNYRDQVFDILVSALVALTIEYQVSSLHITFSSANEWGKLKEKGFLQRIGMQYHWTNHNYRSFDEFLMDMKQSKRKNIRQERKKMICCKNSSHWMLTSLCSGADDQFSICEIFPPSMHIRSMSFTDDDPEDPSNHMRVRAQRKRKKHGLRGRSDFSRKILARLLKWWPAVLLFFAASLLIFEAFKIGGSEIRNPLRQEKVATRNTHTKPPGNLNKLDPITRVAGGIRERCLKLLPPEELELLEIPNDTESRSSIKELVYAMDTGEASNERKFNLSTVYMEGARFNFFTGNQTLYQREQNFKVTESAVIHCGFYSDAGGFRVSEEDKSYMKACNVVVSTCAFGGGDDLYQPIGMSKKSLREVCYVAFWDEITLATQEAQGNKVDESHSIGNWRIIIVRDLPFRDQRLNGKIPKMLPHRLFPNARYSIWVDSKSQFRRDPLGVLEALLWRSHNELAISEHGARSSVYDEAKAVIKKNKAIPEEVDVQLAQYRQDGLPEDKRFNGKKALAEASIIMRKHTEATNLFMCLWFNEVVRFTSRDQLSFPYVLWRLKGLLHINMFPVCTRKDLVNSMGHVRKAKPLMN